MADASRQRTSAVIALSGTLLILLAVLAWSWSTDGTLGGTVTLAGVCRGNTQSGDTPATRCAEAPAAGAAVVVSSVGGRTVNVRTDDRGEFRLLLPAGSYEIGAWV